MSYFFRRHTPREIKPCSLLFYCFVLDPVSSLCSVCSKCVVTNIHPVKRSFNNCSFYYFFLIKYVIQMLNNCLRCIANGLKQFICWTPVLAEVSHKFSSIRPSFCLPFKSQRKISKMAGRLLLISCKRSKSHKVRKLM